MSYRQPFILRKERNFGQKIEASFEFIRITLKPLFSSMLFYTSPFVLIGMFLVANLLNKTFSLVINSTEGAMASESDYLMLGLSMIGFLFLMVFAGTMVMCVVYGTMWVYEQKGSNQFTHKDVWKRIAKIYWPVFGTVFVYGLIFFVAYIIIIVPLSLVLALLSFLVLPVVYIIIGFFMVVMLMAIGSQIFEKKSLGTGMSHAFKLLKQNWWSSLGIFIVLMLIYNVVTFIFSAPFYANFIIQSINTTQIDFMEEPALWQQLLSYLLGAILLLGTFFSYSLPLVGMNLQYFNLSEKRDAKSLIGRIDQLGTTTDEEEEHY